MAPFPRWLRTFSVVVLLLPLIIPLGLMLLSLTSPSKDSWQELGLFVIFCVLVVNLWLPLLALAWGRSWPYTPIAHAVCLLLAFCFWLIQGKGWTEWGIPIFVLWPALPLLGWGAWRLGEVTRRETGK